ncbi:MAG: cytochrome C biogenesis protein [Micrococcales bacterium 70-64]|nr:cytochrome c biogenesis protein ResB [Leifsonia sp.]ODU63949.1 MAG: cytochrome C biogenesis protein [Leifsonia sp. SCN 70-46]OJX85640.1 MAG: cytochrome C biogenesis protein [Micrococcales bacterium 70-64]
MTLRTGRVEEEAGETSGRPEDHFDRGAASTVVSPPLGVTGWARWSWRQLTSMRTALLLLLLLALAAVPGSLFPQRSSDPNGVVQYFKSNPSGAKTIDALQLFNVYTSVWFSAIYLLLFISLIGCVIPRTRHHWIALRQSPPRTPRNMARLPAYERRTFMLAQNEVEPIATIRAAERILRAQRYRTRLYENDDSAEGVDTVSVSAERGYLRETGNLVFHVALIGILLTVAIGGGFTYTGQRVVVEGQTFVNTRSAYDSFTPGRFFSDSQLEPYSLTLNAFSVTYVEDNPSTLGFITDYTASVSTQEQNATQSVRSKVRVNEPLTIDSTQVYLLGNGYAPEIVVKNPAGDVVFTDTIPFLPQDANLTSLGVIKVPDGLAEQVGMIGFFYPTKAASASGAFASIYPDLQNPVLTLNVYTGDLGLSNGDPKSVYALDTSKMTQIAGRGTTTSAIEIRPGESALLPDGLGSVEFLNTKRFASFDISHDPTKGFMLFFAITVIAGLAAAFFVPRRRVWVRATKDRHGLTIEYGGLSRGDDPGLENVIDSFANHHANTLEQQSRPITKGISAS